MMWPPFRLLNKVRFTGSLSAAVRGLQKMRILTSRRCLALCASAIAIFCAVAQPSLLNLTGATVTAPAGIVTINGGCELVGGLASDGLSINSTGALRLISPP
jgi:hypothetical protein